MRCTADTMDQNTMSVNNTAIVGPTGIGKTYNAYALAVEFFGEREVFMCRHIEDLLFYNHQPVIIFDDISFDLIAPTQLIKLVDGDFHSSIRILRKIIQIQPTVLKIFTHNNKSAFEPILATAEQQKAINRRLTICQCQKRQQVLDRLSEIYRTFTIKHL